MVKLLVSLALVMVASAPAPPASFGDSAGRHDLHLTHTRLTVGEKTVRCRVRLFHDDLELVLQRAGGQPALRVTAQSAHDSLFGSYFNKTVQIANGGRTLTARVMRSGRDIEATDFPMWWYELELSSATAIGDLSVLYGLMFDQFADQRNIITAVQLPSGDRQSMYFAANDPKPQLLRFNK